MFKIPMNFLDNLILIKIMKDIECFQFYNDKVNSNDISAPSWCEEASLLSTLGCHFIGPDFNFLLSKAQSAYIRCKERTPAMEIIY